MKFTLLRIMIFSFAIAMLFSCAKNDSIKLKGEQSEFGEVGNEIDLTIGQFGFVDTDMYVSELNDGVSTFVCSATSTDDQILDILKMMPTDLFAGDFKITGDTIETTINAKVTDEGAQLVFEDGSKLTLIKYDAKVGDKYTTTVGGVKLENEVTEKSTDDDYYWGGMLIKATTVKYKSHTPGVLYVEHVYNHKFGLVGLAVYFEDGSIKYVGVSC